MDSGPAHQKEKQTSDDAERAGWWRRRWKAAVAIVGAALVGAMSTFIADGVNSGIEYVSRPPEPFGWTMDLNVEDASLCHVYVIDRTPGEVGDRPRRSELYGWAKKLGAVDGGTTVVDVYLQGHTDVSVVLRGMRVVVDRRLPPAGGARYGVDSGCGGTLDRRIFNVDLDARSPTPKQEVPEGERPANFPYVISSENPEALRIYATARRCLCEWHIELDWASQGREGTTRIDDLGRAFRTSREEESSDYVWVESEDTSGEWCRVVDLSIACAD